MRQQEHRQRAEQHQRDETAATTGADQRRLRQHLRVVQLARQPPQHEQRQHQHRQQLEHRLHRHRQHQPAVVLGDIGPAGAEQDRKHRHRQRHIQRAVTEDRCRLRTDRTGGDHRKTHRHRFELQRDVGNHAQRGHAGDHRGQPGIAAQACGDQVGQRGGVGFARQLDQPAHEACRQQIEHDRPDQGRRDPPAMAHGLGHGAVEGPRGAVHRQRQRIHMVPVPGQRIGAPLAIQRGGKHQHQPRHAGQGDGDKTQHCSTSYPAPHPGTATVKNKETAASLR